jgi:hypothetical protein
MKNSLLQLVALQSATSATVMMMLMSQLQTALRIFHLLLSSALVFIINTIAMFLAAFAIESL